MLPWNGTSCWDDSRETKGFRAPETREFPRACNPNIDVLRGIEQTNSAAHAKKKQYRGENFIDEHIARTIGEICALKIQGAQQVAKAAVIAAAAYLKHHPSTNEREFLDVLTALEAARPTEPALRNALSSFILNGGREQPVRAAAAVTAYFSQAEHAIASQLLPLLHEHKQYFTHCHSGTVVRALIACSKRKEFSVANTETRPLFQGRRTALELARARIPVLHAIDSSARLLIKGCAAVLLGCDAILADGSVVNKIGSEMFAEIAAHLGKPVYVLTSAFKFSGLAVRDHAQRIEERSPNEVWPGFPREPYLTILNYAFERIAPEHVTAIISELGVLAPHAFVQAVEKAYPWMLERRKDG